MRICAIGMVSALLSFGLGCSDDTTGSSGSDTAWTVTKDASTLTVLEDPIPLLTISIDPAAEGSVTVAIADLADELVWDPERCTLSAAAGVTSCTVSAAAPLSTAIGDHEVSVWAVTSGPSPSPGWRESVDVVDFGQVRDLASINIENSTPCLPNPFLTPRKTSSIPDSCAFLRTRCAQKDWTSISCNDGNTYCNVGEETQLTPGLTCTYDWPETSGVDYGYSLPNFTCSLSGDTQEFQYVGVAPPPNPGGGAYASPSFSPPRPLCQPFYEPCDTGMLDGMLLNCTVAPDASSGAPSILSIDVNITGPPITNAGALAGWQNAELSNPVTDTPVCPPDTTSHAGDKSYQCVCVNNQTTHPVTGAAMPTVSFQVPWIATRQGQTCLGQ